MARYSIGGHAAGAGSSTLPIGSIYAVAAAGGHVREIGVWNTTTTALVVGLCRLTSTGTQGASLGTPFVYDPATDAAQITGFNTHTVAPTLTDGGYRADLGAAIGSGVIWTFGDVGLVIPVGTGQGIGIYIPTGTGQVCDYYFVWDE
jgi:hypothetical protein